MALLLKLLRFESKSITLPRKTIYKAIEICRVHKLSVMMNTSHTQVRSRSVSTTPVAPDAQHKMTVFSKVFTYQL